MLEASDDVASRWGPRVADFAESVAADAGRLRHPVHDGDHRQHAGGEARVDRVPARPRRRPALVLGGALLALVGAVLTGVWVGAFPLPPGAVVLTLVDRASTALGAGSVSGGLDATGTAVLLQLRLPRVLLAVLVGAGLAVSGAAFQGVFRNPLADPYLLGAAAGAGLGATLVIAYSPAQQLGPFGIVPLAAFAGALVGVGCALRWAPRPAARRARPCSSPGSRSPSFLAAGQTLVQQQNTEDLREVYGWLLGQLGRSQWSDVGMVLPYLAWPSSSCCSAAARWTCSRSGTTRPPPWACIPAGCGSW